MIRDFADDADWNRYDYPNVINLAWHPYENIVSFTTSDGELFIYADFVSNALSLFLEKALQPAPFIHDPLAENPGNESKLVSNGYKGAAEARHKRRGTPDTLDDLLGPDSEVDGDDFVSDDDGAGYLDGLNANGKRNNDHLDPINGLNSKRVAGYQAWQPRLHQPFQSGSTPWRGQRRYLCKRGFYSLRFKLILLGLNLTGFVWTVDQDSHHTVTVEFYNRDFHRDFHFTDPYLYDKACLSKVVVSLFRLISNCEKMIMEHFSPVLRVVRILQ